MEHLEQLRKSVRLAKNALIKESKVLLHQLEQLPDANAGTWEEMQRLSARISYLEEEIMEDVNGAMHIHPGRSRLQQALTELKQQLASELARFETRGDNADKLLDINFRIQEIEQVLSDRSDHGRASG